MILIIFKNQLLNYNINLKDSMSNSTILYEDILLDCNKTYCIINNSELAFVIVCSIYTFYALRNSLCKWNITVILTMIVLLTLRSLFLDWYLWLDSGKMQSIDSINANKRFCSRVLNFTDDREHNKKVINNLARPHWQSYIFT